MVGWLVGKRVGVSCCRKGKEGRMVGGGEGVGWAAIRKGKEGWMVDGLKGWDVLLEEE